jgi:PAS domain S-box-containing protein
MNREKILAILYEMACVIGGEVRLRSLLTKTLQRLLFHTSFPCGMALLYQDAIPAIDQGDAAAQLRLEISIGDRELEEHNSAIVPIPAALIRDEIQLVEDESLLHAFPCRKGYYRVFMWLPIGTSGVIVLLAPHMPQSDLPLTRIFAPVMNNLAKAVELCRGYEAYTESILNGQRLAEAALKDISYRHRLILDSVGEGICGLDLDGNATFVNPAAARILGYEPEELQGAPLHNILHPRHSDGTDMAFEDFPIVHAMKEGYQPQMVADVFSRRDGSTFPVEYVSTPLLEDGLIVGAVMVFQNLTKYKRAEEALHQLNEELEQRVKERTAELETKNAELERMNRLFVGRELRMVELKQKISELENMLTSIVPVKAGGTHYEGADRE